MDKEIKAYVKKNKLGTLIEWSKVQGSRGCERYYINTSMGEYVLTFQYGVAKKETVLSKKEVIKKEEAET